MQLQAKSIKNIFKSKPFDAKSQTSTQSDQQSYNHHHFTYGIISKHNKIISNKTKTSLCRNYIEKSYCPYGDKCQFAHGPQQLQINMEYNRSYKTKICHAFSQNGQCYYGNRCNFIHEKTLNNQPVCIKKMKIYQNFGVDILQIQQKKQSSILRMIKQSKIV